MKKDETSKGLSETDLAGSCQSGVNDAGTCELGDTGLTQRRSPTVRGSKVYFIRSGDAIKIGVSINPEQRFGELQVGSALELELLGVIVGDKYTEKEVHARFERLHIRGEWFHADPPLLDFIESHARGTGDRPRSEPIPIPPPQRRQPKPRAPLSEEARAMIGRLINVREAHGAGTPIGHACSTLAEIIPNLAGYQRPAWATHRCQTLPWMAEQQMKRIEAIRAQPRNNQ